MASVLGFLTLLWEILVELLAPVSNLALALAIENISGVNHQMEDLSLSLPLFLPCLLSLLVFLSYCLSNKHITKKEKENKH